MKSHSSLWIVPALLGAQLQTAPVALAGGPQTQPFGAEDLVSLHRMSDIEAAPDGRHVLYTLRTTDLKANRGRTDIWSLELGRRGEACAADRRAGQ
jgi:hypothetical protein